MSNPERISRVVEEFSASEQIRDGMTVAIGEPYPMTLIRAIIRRKVKNLTVICSGVALDMLIAAGCVQKVIAYYAGGGTGIPVAPCFRAAAENNEITIWECDEGILCSGLEASAKDLPYLPWRGGVGTSIPELNPDLKLIEDPFRGETLIAVPAIRPDVALLHAAQSDAFGNVQHLGGPGWLDLFLHRAANTTIVQVEKVISNEQIRAGAWHTTIDNADAIVRAPYGAHPFYSRGHYIQDVSFVDEYLHAANDFAQGKQDALEQFFTDYVYSCDSHGDYVRKIGLDRLTGLQEY
ncbi:MAG: CoA transferase subunit A [Gammaproteobacteria bacterium]